MFTPYVDFGGRSILGENFLLKIKVAGIFRISKASIIEEGRLQEEETQSKRFQGSVKVNF